MKPKTVASKIKKMLGQTECKLQCLSHNGKISVQVSYLDSISAAVLRSLIEAIDPCVEIVSIERYHSQQALEYAHATMLYDFLSDKDLTFMNDRHSI